MPPRNFYLTLFPLHGHGRKAVTLAAKLTQGTDGNFYGTTQTHGTNGRGTAFMMTPGAW